ncbi:MAG: hypothetical protein OJF51_003860 [Nitrospira sp.]|jgi:hypothetical protein|nr:MAG: hypothetical protein OJF51_003860 [Nitrospira sp.]
MTRLATLDSDWPRPMAKRPGDRSARNRLCEYLKDSSYVAKFLQGEQAEREN